MSQIPLLPALSPELNVVLAPYEGGGAQVFATLTNTNLAILQNRIRFLSSAAEHLTAVFGYGALSGGAMTIGVGLSVNVAALTALVGNWVGFDASQVVSGLAPHSIVDGALNYLFLRQDGTWYANTTGTAPDNSDGHGAAFLWGTATTSGGAVTAVSNVRRTFRQNVAEVPLYTADPPNAQAGDVYGRTDTTELVIEGLARFTPGGGGGGAGDITWGGVYDNTVTYAVNTLTVGGDGLGYISKNSTLGHPPPDAAHWQPLGTQGLQGDPGIQGDPGTAGAQGYNDRGAWSALTAYVPYDVTLRGRNRYISILAGTNQDPATATAYWQIFVLGGNDGAPGAPGADGRNGSTWYFSNGVPDDANGADGDAAFDYSSGDTYLKVTGHWEFKRNLTGRPGSPGVQGILPNTISANAQTGTAYSLQTSDAGRVVELTNAAAITMTFPAQSSSGLAVGSVVEFMQGGAGQVTFSPAGGVTLHSDGGKLKLSGQYAVARARMRAVDIWILDGDLST